MLYVLLDSVRDTVLQKLSDPGAVANSRQFPFRYFSAYDVLDKVRRATKFMSKFIFDSRIVIKPGCS